MPTAVADGHEAIARMKSAFDSGKPFRLLLLDLQMPGMDGLEATREIRKIEDRKNSYELKIKSRKVLNPKPETRNARPASSGQHPASSIQHLDLTSNYNFAAR